MPNLPSATGLTRLVALAITAGGCGIEVPGAEITSGAGTGATDTGGVGSTTENDHPTTGVSGEDEQTGGVLFDVGNGGETSGETCTAPQHRACDDAEDLANAIGLNCPGDPPVTVTVTAHPTAVKTWSSFGQTAAYDPREGRVFAVLSTGSLEDEFAVGKIPTQEECDAAYGADSSVPGGEHYPPPPPLRFEDAGPVTCDVDPSLVGMGDCSNTLESTGALDTLRDYAAIRVDAAVPEGATSLGFDFAFLTYEYPFYWEDLFNDFFFVWLESETWSSPSTNSAIRFR